MTDIPEIEPGEGGGGGVAPVAAAAIAATALCLSCATPIAGLYCVTCGQKNDDMRRSSFVLFKDFIKDTFAFDSRMWRTLGLMAAAPGAVPSNYSHGRRSRYTPPVRLFLVVNESTKKLPSRSGSPSSPVCLEGLRFGSLVIGHDRSTTGLGFSTGSTRPAHVLEEVGDGVPHPAPVGCVITLGVI